MQAIWHQLTGYFYYVMILVIIANGFYFMFTGKFSLFGLDKAAAAIISGIFRGIGRLLGQALTGLGNLLADGIRALFRRQPRQQPQPQPAPQEIHVHHYHHHDGPPDAANGSADEAES